MVAEAFDRLTNKHKAFVIAYLRTFNATKAARDAGYAAGAASITGHRLLRNAKIVEAVTVLLDERGITPERIKVAFAEMVWDSDVAAFQPFLEGDKTIAELAESGVNTALVKSVSITPTKEGTSRRIELYARDGALEKLGRVLAMFQDKVDLTSKGERIPDRPDEFYEWLEQRHRNGRANGRSDPKKRSADS